MPNTPNERILKTEEIGNVIEGMNKKKAKGEDGITAEIHKNYNQNVSKNHNSIVQQLLKNGVIPVS